MRVPGQTLNAPEDPNPFFVSLANLAAAWSMAPVLAILAALWIWAPPHRRGALLAVVAVLPIAMALNGLIGWIYVHPRPFVLGIGYTLVPHAADPGFPSDHVTPSSGPWASALSQPQLRDGWAR